MSAPNSTNVPGLAGAQPGPHFANSWVFQPLGQLGSAPPRALLPAHLICPFPGMKPPPRFFAQALPATPYTQCGTGGASAGFCTHTQSEQLESSGASGATASGASTTQRSAVGTPQQPPSAACTPGGTVLPSTDEQQLHALVSKLRLALDIKTAAACALTAQVEVLQQQLVSCDAERRGLQVQLLEGKHAPTHSMPGVPSQASPASESLLQGLRQQLSREAQQAAEARGECDALRAQVAAMHEQLEATVQAGSQEQERLAMEAAQCRLLCRARARQVEQLQAQLDEVAASRSAQDEGTAAQVEAAEAKAAAAGREVAEALKRAEAAELAAAGAERDLLAAHEATAQSDSRCTALQAEVAELRQHVDWQAHRIEELQHSAAGQLIRKYDMELSQLRAQHEAERRQLLADLASARDGQAQQAAIPNNPSWDDIFDEAGESLRAAIVQEAAVQTDGGNDACAAQDMGPPLLEAANEEIGRLQAAHHALQEAYTAAQQRLAEVLSSQQHAISPAERDAAVQQAAAAERALAADRQRRAEAAWRERLALLEGQAAHQCSQLQALNSANERLELAASTLKEQLASAQCGEAQLASLQQTCARQEQELRSAREEVSQLSQQVKRLRHTLLQQQEEALLKYQQLKSEGMMELAEATAKSQRVQQQLRNCLAGAEEELQLLRLKLQVPSCSSGTQCEPGPQGVEAAVQTEPAALLPSEISNGLLTSTAAEWPMGARELQAELAKITITPSRLQVSRWLQTGTNSALLGQPPMPLPPGRPAAPAVLSPARVGLTAERASPGGSAMHSPVGAAASEESYGTPLDGTPVSTLAPLSMGATPAGGMVQPMPCGALLADISAHPSFQTEVPPMGRELPAGMPADEADDAFRCLTPTSRPATASPPGSEAGAPSRLSSQGEALVDMWASAPARTSVPRLPLVHLSQRPSPQLNDALGRSDSGSLLCEPLTSLASSPSGTLRSSTALSNLRSSPRLKDWDLRPAPAPPATIATYDRALGRQASSSSSLLTDILNLKQCLAPARSNCPMPSSSGSESMQSRLDASLERLARLTGGIVL